MAENALDRLNRMKISNSAPTQNYSLDAEIDDAISTDEFLDGMSDFVKQQIDSGFEEVTLDNNQSTEPNIDDIINEATEDSYENIPETTENQSIYEETEPESTSRESVQDINPNLEISDDSDLNFDSLKKNLGAMEQSNVIENAIFAGTEDTTKPNKVEKAEIKQLKSQLKDSETTIQKLNKQLNSAAKDIDTYKVEVSKLTAKNTKLTSDNNSLFERNKELTEKNRQLKASNSKLQEDLQSLTKKVNTNHEDLFNYNIVEQQKNSSIIGSNANPIYDQLALNLVDLCKSNNLKLDRFNDSAMNQLYCYIISKFTQ